MSDITFKRLRFLLYPGPHAVINDIITNEAPIVWRGADCRVEVAIGASASTIETNITNIANIYMELHSGSRNGNLWPTPKSPDDGYTEITQEDWDGGLTADCHYGWDLTRTDMQIDLTATSQANLITTFWLVWHCELDTGEFVTLRAANLKIEEDGVQNDISGVTPTSTVRVVDGDLQMYDFADEQWKIGKMINGALVWAAAE